MKTIKTIKLAFRLFLDDFSQLKILKLGGARYSIARIKVGESSLYPITVSIEYGSTDHVGGTVLPYYFKSLLGMAKCFDGKEALDPSPDLKTIIP